MKIDCHMHTPLCGHAFGNPIDYVRSAASKGIEVVTFTCHIPMNDAGFGGRTIRMTHDNVPEYFELINVGAEEGQRLGVEVLTGIEAEVFPDEESLRSMDDFLAAESFDFVLGSLHHQLPCYQDWLVRSGVYDDFAIIETYFKHLKDAVASGRYHSIAHPDVIRIYGTVRRFEPSEHEATIRQFLQAAVDHDVCIEVNTSGLSKGVYEVHPDPLIMDWACDLGVRLTIGSDSHRPEDVGRHYDDVLRLLKRKGFRTLNYFRQGERIEAPIAD